VFAQGATGEKQRMQEKIVTPLLRSIQAHETRIKSASEQLTSGKAEQIRTLLLNTPDTPLLKDLDRRDVMALHPRVFLGYLSKQEQIEKGMESFPLAPSYSRAKLYDRIKHFLTAAEIKENPLKLIFDGTVKFWNTIRVSESKRLAPLLWMYGARRFQQKMLDSMNSGYQLGVSENPLSKPHDEAGILEFDKARASRAHGTWASLLWLKHPSVTEVRPAVANERLAWKPQMEGGFVYALKEYDALQDFVAQHIRSKIPHGNPPLEKQAEWMIAALPKSQMLVLATSNMHHIENAAQQISGAAVVQGDDTRKPILIGQVLWRLNFTDGQGKHRTALLFSGPEMTEMAIKSKDEGSVSLPKRDLE
jgi:hypothetical protein